MGFQINSVEVLGTTGFANYTNTFKTLDGNSILGSGNITDNGADSLLFNKIGSYTVAMTGNPVNQSAAVAATALYYYYNSQYGGYSYALMSSTGSSLSSNAYHGLSGTWMSKAPSCSPSAVSLAGCIWQRIT